MEPYEARVDTSLHAPVLPIIETRESAATVPEAATARGGAPGRLTQNNGRGMVTYAAFQRAEPSFAGGAALIRGHSLSVADRHRFTPS